MITLKYVLSIPDFQSIMLPLIELTGDGKEHKLSDAIDRLATNQFHLTDTERKELLPSGKQSKFANRVGWAGTYLKKAGLLMELLRKIDSVWMRFISKQNAGITLSVGRKFNSLSVP
jgi:restriction system protein